MTYLLSLYFLYPSFVIFISLSQMSSTTQHAAERKRIKAAFELFDRDNKGTCSRE